MNLSYVALFFIVFLNSLTLRASSQRVTLSPIKLSSNPQTIGSNITLQVDASILSQQDSAVPLNWYFNNTWIWNVFMKGRNYILTTCKFKDCKRFPLRVDHSTWPVVRHILDVKNITDNDDKLKFELIYSTTKSTATLNVKGRSVPHEGPKEPNHRPTTIPSKHKGCKNGTAQLLPHSYNHERNRPDQYKRSMRINRRNSYCINYRIESLAWHCRYATEYHNLRVGSIICVECHDTAMNQNGYCQGANINVSGCWRSLLGLPCYGTWKSQALTRNCGCGETAGKDFIFI